MPKTLLWLFTILLVIGTSCSKQSVHPHPGKAVSGTLKHNQLKRTYHVYVPSSHDSKNPAPLVLALHGGDGTGKRMGKFTGLNGLADRHGFLAVYPDAVEKHWNDGRGLTGYRSQRENIDDAGFISALIDALADPYPFDRNRVYITGASNGAMMSFRLACELTHKITAIAPVIGSMGANIAKTCTPSRPIPVLIIGGTDDPLVPWNGGDVHVFRRKLGKVLSFAETTQFWVSHNGCSQTPDISWVPDVDPEDGTRIRKKAFRQCNRDVEVILYEIQGGAHTWPGGPQYLPEWVIGITSKDMNGAEVIWEFFERFSR